MLGELLLNRIPGGQKNWATLGRPSSDTKACQQQGMGPHPHVAPNLWGSASPSAARCMSRVQAVPTAVAAALLHLLAAAHCCCLPLLYCSHILLFRLAGAVELRVWRLVGRVLRSQRPLHLPIPWCAPFCCRRLVYGTLAAVKARHVTTAAPPPPLPPRLASVPGKRLLPALTWHQRLASSHLPSHLRCRCAQALRLGLLSGPVCGALGGLSARHGRRKVCVDGV